MSVGFTGAPVGQTSTNDLAALVLVLGMLASMSGDTTTPDDASIDPNRIYDLRTILRGVLRGIGRGL